MLYNEWKSDTSIATPILALKKVQTLKFQPKILLVHDNRCQRRRNTPATLIIPAIVLVDESSLFNLSPNNYLKLG